MSVLERCLSVYIREMSVLQKDVCIVERDISRHVRISKKCLYQRERERERERDSALETDVVIRERDVCIRSRCLC